MEGHDFPIYVDLPSLSFCKIKFYNLFVGQPVGQLNRSINSTPTAMLFIKVYRSLHFTASDRYTMTNWLMRLHAIKIKFCNKKCYIRLGIIR